MSKHFSVLADNRETPFHLVKPGLFILIHPLKGKLADYTIHNTNQLYNFQIRAPHENSFYSFFHTQQQYIYLSAQ